MAIEEDPFDTLLSLEDGFYQEGYDLGVSDGDRAGLVEGRLFGLEKGFEKYARMGELNGKAAVWAGRMPDTNSAPRSPNVQGVRDSASNVPQVPSPQHENEELPQNPTQFVPRLPINARLETHIRTLYALTELGSLSTENKEDSISSFDDRLKRAEGKAKILEKLTGESSNEDVNMRSMSQDEQVLPLDFTYTKGEGSIEDISKLH